VHREEKLAWANGKHMFDEEIVYTNHKLGSEMLGKSYLISSDIHPLFSEPDGQHLQACR